MSDYFSYILMPRQKEAQGKKNNHLLPKIICRLFPETIRYADIQS
jgi:hypothetical protein